VRRTALVAVLVLGVAACGGGHGKGGGQQGAPGVVKQGGKLTVLWSDDVDSIDCGQTYYEMGTFICSATQRTLYYYRPTDGTHMVPDLAESPPRVSRDGRTVTVRLKEGVRFSPPVDRAVTARDVKYAIERTFYRTVDNGYVGAYFGDLRGARARVRPGTPIAGITTPDARTIVFQLTRPTGAVLAAGALSLPVTAPVPRAYALKFDRPNPSSYGVNQVATGPYMIRAGSTGQTVGYTPGKGIDLVRNPNWDRTLDFRPAYLDEIDMPQGNADTVLASRRILTGRSMINGDFSPPPSVVEQALEQRTSQLTFVPGGATRWVSLNTAIPPFGPANPDNPADVEKALNLRKAVMAGLDRNAMRRTVGGALAGAMPTHFLPPGVPGFQQAGGLKGPGYDFLNATGEPNPQLAADYLKKAGYPSGRYAGPGVLMVGSADGVARQAAQVSKASLERLGFKVRLQLVAQDTMYTRYCGLPAARVQVCPNVRWLKQFADPQTLLGPTFDGGSIVAANNLNWSQLDDPEIDAEMDRAETISDPARRALAWAQVDKDVTAQAPAVPWSWDRTPLIASANVRAVASQYNSQWDLAWTSLR
jgi:peptide/nickel transport system substrate-binding protein